MNTIDRIICAVLGLLGMALLVLGLGMLGYQSYVYLHDGDWPPLGAASTLGWFFNWQWGRYPTTWIGLHNVLEFLNVGVALGICAMVIFMVAATIRESAA